MAPTIAAEWCDTAGSAERADFNALIARGVSSQWLRAGPMRFGVGRIETHSDGTYELNPDGRRAFIVPAAPVPSDFVFEAHDPHDLVAFDLREPERWWLRLGVSVFLNPLAVERADYFGEALKVWRSPLAWLCARGEGTVILDPKAHLPLHLGNVCQVIAESLALGEEIERRLRVPTPETRILIREAA